MSYDVWTEADLGAGAVRVGHLNENMTWNVGRMIADADGQYLSEWDGISARDAANRANHVANVLDADPVRYNSMNPKNGWGSREGCVAFMRKIAWECAAVPNAIFRVG